MEEAQFEAVKKVLMKYCNPKKEFDHISPRTVVEEIVTAVEANAKK